MNIYIPSFPHFDLDKRRLFVLCRPFFIDARWLNDVSFQATWGLKKREFSYTNQITEANMILLPFSINDYFARGNASCLKEYNALCNQNGIKAYAVISGDLGMRFPEFENITYFRMSGFRSQLSNLNQGFPAALSDHYTRLYGKKDIDIRQKETNPVIGFCGHATLSAGKRIKENLKYIIENLKRGLNNPFRNDWEPLFPSGYQRASLLNNFEQSEFIKTNFIYRSKYRGGAKTTEQLKATTFQYYENMRQSDYVFCLRGGGNFSIRLYETLMMGRIPVFINTDCLLPQTDNIVWKKHVVWVEWGDKKHIAELLMDFHNEIHSDDFIALQLANRELWNDQLSVSGILRYIVRK